MCEKKKYYSESTALSHLTFFRQARKKNKSMRKVKVNKAYQCPECGFWHLTSQV